MAGGARVGVGGRVIGDLGGGWGPAEGRSGAGQAGKCAVFGNDVWENVGLGGIRWVGLSGLRVWG